MPVYQRLVCLILLSDGWDVPGEAYTYVEPSQLPVLIG